MKSYVNRLVAVGNFLRNAKTIVRQESYFPEEKHKSFFQMFLDYLEYVYKYGQEPKFYFVYGLDCAASNKREYMPYPQFLRLRQQTNIVRIGNQTRYSYVCLLRDKGLFELIAREWKIPTPKIDGVLLGGAVFCDSERIEIEDYLRGLPDGTSLFIKEKSGVKGSGAYSLDKKANVYYLNEKEVSLESISGEVPDDTEYIIQKRLSQHSDMSKLYPHALNTLRVVSVIHKGEVVILGSLLRIGANGSQVDNWAHGGVAVGINKDGTHMKWGLYKPGYGTKTDKHPNTSVTFEGFQLPFWNETICLVNDTHKKLSRIPTVGWDIAITETGPIIIEGNDDYDGALLQACTGGKKKEFLKYYQ